MEKDFDVAYAPWGPGGNGSILAFVPTRTESAFPIKAYHGIEEVAKDFFGKFKNVHKLTQYDAVNYKDGFFWDKMSNREVDRVKMDLGAMGLIKIK